MNGIRELRDDFSQNDAGYSFEKHAENIEFLKWGCDAQASLALTGPPRVRSLDYELNSLDPPL